MSVCTPPEIRTPLICVSGLMCAFMIAIILGVSLPGKNSVPSYSSVEDMYTLLTLCVASALLGFAIMRLASGCTQQVSGVMIAIASALHICWCIYEPIFPSKFKYVCAACHAAAAICLYKAV